MTTFGYSLSSEEFGPNDLVRYARIAEASGFEFAMISDHFHPWTDTQGQSPFVWSVLGALAHTTKTMQIGTGVTAPIMRIHPAIIAQAVATTASMMPGRFFLGVGTGENLNEHIIGEHWPPFAVRLEMLEEAIAVMRELWKGEVTSHHGRYFTVENARIYTLPPDPPKVMIAAAGEKTATFAGKLGDGFISTAPKADLVQAFRDAGGSGPRYGQVTVCWAEDEQIARKTALKYWPNAAVRGQLGQELALPENFEDAAANVREEDIAEVVVCGPDPDLHHKKLREFIDAGFDHVYIHQVGPAQEEAISFYVEKVLPRL